MNRKITGSFFLIWIAVQSILVAVGAYVALNWFALDILNSETLARNAVFRIIPLLAVPISFSASMLGYDLIVEGVSSGKFRLKIPRN